MYGYDFAQVSGRSYLKSEFHVRYRLTNNGFASFIANYARVDDHVFSNLNALFKDVLSGYAFGYGLDTVVGPIELKYSWSPENRKKYWLFNLGFGSNHHHNLMLACYGLYGHKCNVSLDVN